MTREYLKKATLTSTSDATDVSATVQSILNDIETRGDAGALEYAAKFDKYSGNVILTKEEINAAAALVAGGHVADLQQGAKMAKASIVSGKALAALDGLIAITNGKA